MNCESSADGGFYPFLPQREDFDQQFSKNAVCLTAFRDLRAPSPPPTPHNLISALAVLSCLFPVWEVSILCCVVYVVNLSFQLVAVLAKDPNILRCYTWEIFISSHLYSKLRNFLILVVSSLGFHVAYFTTLLFYG